MKKTYGILPRNTGRKRLTSFILSVMLLGIALVSQGCAAHAPTENKPKTQPAATPRTADNPAVFMTTDISSTGLMKVYDRIKAPISGKTVIKLHMGERGNNNYIRPYLLKELATTTKATLADSNVMYGGARSTTVGHLEVAKEHGFTFAPIDILDADGEIKLPVKGGIQVKEALVGSHIMNYDSIIVVSHFKGHALAGFGGTFKNVAVGIASTGGKRAIHSGGYQSGNAFIERVVDYFKAVADAHPGKMVYINVLNNLSVDCDCDSSAAHPSMPDIGILASTDPVALEQASLDLIYSRPKEENQHLVERIESKKGQYQIEAAAKQGLGKTTYKLVQI